MQKAMAPAAEGRAMVHDLVSMRRGSFDAPSWHTASAILEGALRPLREVLVVGAGVGSDRGRDEAEGDQGGGDKGFHCVTSWILAFRILARVTRCEPEGQCPVRATGHRLAQE